MTFVIVDGPAFGDGLINPEDEIVDVTPTVVSLFGALQRSDFDGVPLTTLSGSDVDPVDLHQALQEQIAMNQYPDIVTNVALSARTIFATLPYYVYTGTNDITAQLQTIVTQNIFLIRPLAAVALVPVQIAGHVLYVATNVSAQIVAQLTGVRGASIFPLLPPPPFTSPEQATPPDTAIRLDCGDGSPLRRHV